MSRALGVAPRGVWTFVGAGGKTSAVRRLLRENPRAIASTTTHLSLSGFGIGLLAAAPDCERLDRMRAKLRGARPLTLALRDTGTRLQSPPLEWHARFALEHAGDLLLLECDGAARRLAKLPATHEPAWPPASPSAVVVVLGLDALDRRPNDVLHRPEIFRAAGLETERVGMAHFELAIARYARAAPPRAPLVLLLTGVTTSRLAAAAQLVRHLETVVRGRDPARQDPGVPLRVVATSEIETGPFQVWSWGRRARVAAPRLPGVCGVLLAAGSGTRFGAEGSKLLARWRGATLVEHAVRRWRAAGFAELLVVTGHDAARIEPLVRRAARGARLHLVRNPRPARGLGSSVRIAAQAAPADMGLLFGHADMPAVRPETLRRIATLGSTLRHCIVVPTRRGAPRNPVYFPADLRGELARVMGASGGKPVYGAHPERVFHLELDDGDDLVDIDTPADLRRLP